MDCCDSGLCESSMADMNGLKLLNIDDMEGFDMGDMPKRMQLLDIDNVEGFEMGDTISSTGVEVKGCSKNDGSCIPLDDENKLDTGDINELRSLNVDAVNEFDILSLSIVSPGVEVTACIKNDGSCIPLRKLGSFQIPAIITGMWQVAGAHGTIDIKKAVNEMKLYSFAGLGVFDMADTYGPAEEIYGMFCREYWGRKPVLGFTKFVPGYGNSGSDTRPVVEAVIDRSRNRMGVTTLDMVQFHWWDYSDGRYCDAMKWLYTLQQEGKIKHLGLTNFDTQHMVKIVEDCGIQVVSNQVAYSVIDTRPEKKMVAWCLQHDVKLLAYGTLLGGLLSETYLGQPEPLRTDPTSTPSINKYRYVISQWGGWALFQELLLVLSEIANKYKVSISNVAIRYIADKPTVAAVIVGAQLGISEHIASTQATYSFPGLDEGDIAAIHFVVKKGTELPGDCGDEYR